MTFSRHSLIKLLLSTFDPQRTIRNNYFLCITERCNIVLNSSTLFHLYLLLCNVTLKQDINFFYVIPH